MSTSTIATTIAQAKSAAKAAGRALARAGESQANAVTLAAYATFDAFTVGLLGGRDAAMTQKDYAETFYGVTENNVTLWKTLGHALRVVGLDESGETYRLLSRKGGAGFANVKAAILADNATEASIVTALGEYFHADGRKMTATERKARTAGDGTVSQTSGNGSGSTEGITPDVLADASVKGLRDALKSGLTPEHVSKVGKALARVLSDYVKSMDAETWASTETIMGAIITREVTVRAKAAKAEATVTTRKARARKGAESVAS